MIRVVTFTSHSPDPPSPPPPLPKAPAATYAIGVGTPGVCLPNACVPSSPNPLLPPPPPLTFGCFGHRMQSMRIVVRKTEIKYVSDIFLSQNAIFFPVMTFSYQKVMISNEDPCR